MLINVGDIDGVIWMFWKAKTYVWKYVNLKKKKSVQNQLD